MKIIELDNITKTYHTGTIDVPVLHGISLSIARGEFVAIMGHSGSGKSTLLNILGLLDTPTGGAYRLAGREVSRLPEDSLAALRNRFLGFVFQQFNLLGRLSAVENVLLPLVYSGSGKNGATAKRDGSRLLEKVGLGQRLLHKPNELSGGQQQRVAIARSLINNPLLLLADEPTGNLDTKSAAEIIHILKELNDSGITIVMVTHEPDLAQAASRIITLEDGRIVSDAHIAQIPAAGGDSGRPLDEAGAKGHPVANTVRIANYFGQSLRALLSNKTRSVLSILGVLIGVASLIAMMAVGKGAQEEVKKNISSLGSNLLIVRPASPRMGGVAVEAGAAVRLTLADADDIREAVPGIDKVAPYSSGRGQVVYNGKNWNTSIDGTSADYPYMRNAAPAKGRFFTHEETVSRAKVALVGQTIVRELFDGENPIGEYIRIKRIDFQVIGVLPEKGASGWRDEDDCIIIPVNTAMYRLMGKEHVDRIDVRVTDFNAMDKVSEGIRQRIMQLHRLPGERINAVDVRNMADIQNTISSTTKAFSYLLGSIAFISLLVGGIGIMNIMLVSVTERTREIGLRKALGANNKDILFQFIIESVVICVLGGITGIVLGSSVSLTLAHVAHWSTKISPASVTMAFTFSVLVGLIFGVWPAKKASRLNPIEALRYE